MPVRLSRLAIGRIGTAATALVGLSWCLPVAAAPRPADCKLVVKGKTYISGVCDFEADKDGSFRINGDKYFAYVNLTGPGKAEGSWNADPQSTHAHAPLGTLTRKGACWENASAQVCARDLDPKQRAAIVAKRPQGAMLYPDVGGASQTCLGAQGGRWAAGAALVLYNCQPNVDKVFGVEGGQLRIGQPAGLCVEPQAGAAGKAARLVLQACGDAASAWRTQATSTESAAVRSASGQCWTIPDLDKPEKPFPYAVMAAPCAAQADRNLKFFLAKD